MFLYKTCCLVTTLEINPPRSRGPGGGGNLLETYTRLSSHLEQQWQTSIYTQHSRIFFTLFPSELYRAGISHICYSNTKKLLVISTSQALEHIHRKKKNTTNNDDIRVGISSAQKCGYPRPPRSSTFSASFSRSKTHRYRMNCRSKP